MFLELIAVFAAGFAGAGGMLLLSRLSGGRLPKWAVPVGAGAAMIAASISSEYSWYSRTTATLPEGMEVAHAVQSRSYYRPWTFVAPLTERFVALDLANLQANDQTEGLYLVDAYLYGRWKPLQSVQFMIDCPGARRADPVLGDGSEPLWRDVGADDPMLRSVCQET
jgi:hypothetical protein